MVKRHLTIQNHAKFTRTTRKTDCQGTQPCSREQKGGEIHAKKQI